MSLWIVIYIAGAVAETIGPLPYDMDECLKRTAEKSAEIDAQFAQRSTIGGMVRTDIRIECIRSERRPAPPSPHR